MTLQEIAARLGAELTPAEGLTSVPDGEITGVAGIETAGPGEITFVANKKYIPLIRKTQAAAILIEPKFGPVPVPTLRIENPYLAFARAIELFYQPPAYPPGIHPTAVVDPSAKVGARAHLGAYVVVSAGCTIGDDAVILPHVVLYPNVTVGDRFFAHAHAVVREDCRIGNDVVLQNGVVIGADGFGFAKDASGRWIKILQSGPTILENDVEVQANSCIDRASIGETRIANGVKVDNLVQVGHGSSIGDNTLLCAQVGLAGSSATGKNVILAGQVGLAGHLFVGDGAIITAQSGLHADVPPGAVMSGSPAMDNKSWLRSIAAMNRLPDILKKLRREP
ncbi:MAG TPA: UDP-3-O-(3-hydroxymyristoyl)glucosamine N-acyltransferase [Acidobacteriaceae bacterium]|jgi:UDP-3-O-[3-hydroxymyristoyl] glucosamine N-acyltransferase